VLLSKDVWRQEMEFQTAKDAATRSLSWFDCSNVSSVSSDGDKVAFFECGEATAVSYLSYLGYVSYLRKTDGSPAVKLGDGQCPVFSPDEKWVLAKRFSPTRLALLPTGIGEAKELDAHGVQDFSNLGWMPNGSEIYFAGDDGHSWRMYAQDLGKGEIRTLTPPIVVDPAHMPNQLVSPDGRFCFARDLSGMGWLYSLAGSEPQVIKGLLRVDKWIGWTSNSQSAFVFQNQKTEAPIFQLDPVSGRRKLVGKAVPQDPSGVTSVDPVRITPDGKAYAFTYNRSLSDLFVLQGVR
jgi:Tol biopolymer transport system component